LSILTAFKFIIVADYLSDAVLARWDGVLLLLFKELKELVVELEYGSIFAIPFATHPTNAMLIPRILLTNKS
jgi:hypothetical protein